MDEKAKEDSRRNFPVTERYVYLDHAGVAPMSRPAAEAVARTARESAEGGAFQYAEWAQRVQEARRRCALLVNAAPSEIAFIKSTSHGLSLVAEGLAWQRGDNLIVAEKEFPSNLYPWMHLGRKGVELRKVRSSGGAVRPADIERLMDARTRLVSLSAVQFATGFRADLRSIGGLCRSRGVLFCVDAIQALGIVPIDVCAGQIDFLSADAHKWLLGPEGVGLFYCREDLAEQLTPPLVGWKSVVKDLEFESPSFTLKRDALRFEEGSLNLIGIFGMDASIRLLMEQGIGAIEDEVLALGERVMEHAVQRGFSILTPREWRERAGIVTFTGSFTPLAVREGLRNKGIMVNVRAGGLRVSPHYYTTKQEIDRLFHEIDSLTS